MTSTRSASEDDSDNNDNSDDADTGRRRNPRRATAPAKESFIEVEDSDDDAADDDAEMTPPASSDVDDDDEDIGAVDDVDVDDDGEVDEEDDEDEVEALGNRRSTRARAPARSNPRRSGGRPSRDFDNEDDEDDDDMDLTEEVEEVEEVVQRRTSSRSNKFRASMRDAPSESVADLFLGVAQKIDKAKPKKKPSPSKARRQSTTARRHVKNSSEDDDDEDDDEDEIYDSDESSASEDDRPRGKGKQAGNSKSSKKYIAEDDEEKLKIQRILASRSETKAKWKKICDAMNTSEITNGSRWFQSDDDDDDDEVENDTDGKTLQERYLVKWSDLSYAHVSWETQDDLMEEIEGAKTYLTNFFRKAENGIYFHADERCDGDYFDPAYLQIERILESYYDDAIDLTHNRKGSGGSTKLPTTVEMEERIDPIDEFDICLDKTSDEFESGTGRQFLVKWKGRTYSEMSWEFERDLILNDIEYQQCLRDWYGRIHKPTKVHWRTRARHAEEAKRRTYKIFGDSVERDETLVKTYQTDLEKAIYPNGGQLRDYQAEGVSWMISNYVNQRSCILADEMGLGKTLQTVSFVNLLMKQLHRPGPFLIVVPLSTITHWYREFVGWSDLNTIIYHGSADDRKFMRHHDFTYPVDRPDPKSLGANSLYLKKCVGKARSSTVPCWMIHVVITTPEMMVADDTNELASMPWECLIVDEAHRLKNHSSKLAVNLRDPGFLFKHKVLLTGTPIQNDVEEFWALLNFIDPKGYPSLPTFMAQYGDIKSKEKIDELHQNIRPYILRRLKEDVEKSVPPKEETLIEVELTADQKQYYRALYEKNVKFLHKNKKKALDGPSLNNLAMQLRKVCNHLFLLNGVEEEMRNQINKKEKKLDEADFVVKGSGKLVLLDKLLPRLKQDGHRVLIFSQFKIMLDVLEDYLGLRQWKFERIDGSITGKRRQQAIDRFQDGAAKDPPFIMLLSTRAGGVGINLTAADTCIIFDSDWNPQNDLQAQARCHRIGQTKSVKVYRLLSRKTYEMQMFHMSSLKMGLDQAVLKGFESGAAGDIGLTKEEVERLLRHGAYDIFNEEKTGSAEAESNAFIQQDIDSILERRSRTVVHKNTGTESNAKGGSFSKASFRAPKTPDGKQALTEDIDIEDPDFWTKMVGAAAAEEEAVLKPRKRNRTNYSEKSYEKQIEQVLEINSDSSSEASKGSDDDHDDSSVEDDTEVERSRWGGKRKNQWHRKQADILFKRLETYGYCTVAWEEFSKVPDSGGHTTEEVKRMCWSLILMCMLDCVAEEVERKRGQEKKSAGGDGLARMASAESINPKELENTLKSYIAMQDLWIGKVFVDAVSYAQLHEPRQAQSSQVRYNKIVENCFYTSLWPGLKARGWKELLSDDDAVKFTFQDIVFTSPIEVVSQVARIHTELANMSATMLMYIQTKWHEDQHQIAVAKLKYTALSPETAEYTSIKEFLAKFAPFQLLNDRTSPRKMPLHRRVLTNCFLMSAAAFTVRIGETGSTTSTKNIAQKLSVDYRVTLPHPLWTMHHDAVLIQAITKHGWISDAASCKRIVADKEIKWGKPFDTSDGEPDQSTKNIKEKADKEFLEHLRQTAKRVCDFLNDNGDLLDSLKSVNQKALINSYGLQEVVKTPEDEGETKSEEVESVAVQPVDTASKWVVDDALLLQVTKSGTDGSLSDEIIDLPSKKDLAKRAKAVLTKTLSVLKSGDSKPPPKASGSGKASGSKTNVPDNHGYATIDLESPLCTFLAELIRGLSKASHTKKPGNARMLCSLAYEEAIELQKTFSAISGKDEYERFTKIAEQIALVKKCVKSAARPGKNVLRVMLGLEAIPVRSENEKLFPTLDDAPVQTMVPKEAAKKSPNRDESALGERAVLRAMKKAQDKYDGGPFRFTRETTDSVGLQLTMIETLMIYTFCIEGIPLASVDADRDSTRHRRYNDFDVISWESISGMLSMGARDFHQGAIARLKKLESAYGKVIAHDGTDEAKSIAMKALRATQIARHDMEMKEDAAKSAHSFESEPVQLAKKSVMLLEKIRIFGGVPSSSPKNAFKLENGLGIRVGTWFGKELVKLGAQMDILDHAGAPLAYTAKELVENQSDFEQFSVASLLDKKTCRTIVAQISLPTRARALFLKYSEADMKTKVAAAAARSKKIGDVWEKKPSWWNARINDSAKATSKASVGTPNDYLLLERLVQFGFLHMQSKVEGFGPAVSEDGSDDAPKKSLKDFGLNKLVIQTRANQLVRELNADEETEESKRLLKQRRTKSKRSSIDSLAGMTNKQQSSSRRQTGMHAFFKSTKTVSKKESLVDLLSDEEGDEAPPPSKRKTIDAVDSEMALAGKKQKVAGN